MSWDEFGLISERFRPLSVGEPGAFALTDDAAVLAAAPGCDWVVTADALVAGVHFFADDPPGLIAAKALRVNLSDLAAMGAVPRAVFMTCAFPETLDRAWLAAFAEGLGADLKAFGVTLAGGDVVATPGPLCLSITAIGEAKGGRVLRRNGVRAGDILAVTGTIGDAALGLDAQGPEAPQVLDAASREFLIGRYRLPQPRLVAGRILNGRAHAALDVSDGLLADLRHLAETSCVDIVVDPARVPRSDAARAWLELRPAALDRVLTGGDDYELAFSCAPEDFAEIAALLDGEGVRATAIGRAEAGEGRLYRIDSGERRPVEGAGGHRHGGEAR
jgi:thiamine-monophosphate kinase